MKKIAAGFLLFMIVWCMVLPAQASAITEEDETSQKEVEEQILNQFDFGDVDQALSDVLPDERLDFTDTLMGIIKGDISFSADLLGRLISDQLFYTFRTNKETLIHILLIAVIAAVFSNFSNAFQNQQISEISFYILYLLLITMCIGSFRILVESVTEGLTQLTTFMKALGPVYFLSVAIAKGSATSIAFYNLVLFLIYLVEMLILNFLLPLIHVYIMVKVLNCLSAEDYLSKFAELLELVVSWTLKTLLACVIGLNVIQGLISPVIDSIKRSAITRGAEAIPGIGDAIGGVAEVVVGTAVLIKNGIGMAGAIVCVGICAGPIIQMAFLALMYKLIAAMVQPISDKRIVGCIGSVGEGCQLLLRTTFTVGVLFLLTVAVVAASTT